jgi:hypothetical protein
VFDASTPEFELHLEKRSTYLYAFINGAKDNADISIRFWKQVLTTAEELNMEKILVEEDFPNQLSTLEVLKVTEFVANNFRKSFKIAHVDKRPSDFELNHFGETVAYNRGLQVRAFQKMEDAEEWLQNS